jgi:hypothetical protein
MVDYLGGNLSARIMLGQLQPSIPSKMIPK